MIARVFVCLTILAGLNVWFLFQLIGEVTSTSGSTQPVAVVKEMSGSVLVRPVAQAEWRSMKFNTPLKVGDVVFVGENSKLVYTYRREQGNITIPSNSIFEITTTPTITSKTLRTFYRTSSIGERKLKKGERAPLKKSRIYVRMEMAPIRNANPENPTEDNDKEADMTGSDASSFGLERNAKVIRIIEPKGDLNIVASHGPLTLPVRFEKPIEIKKMFGYLWKKDGTARPIWTEVVEGNAFQNVSVPAPGEYVFQAVSEDDEYVSPIIRIVFSQPGKMAQEDIIASQFSPETWQGKQVLVLR
jgi:hypothetical protein